MCSRLKAKFFSFSYAQVMPLLTLILKAACSPQDRDLPFKVEYLSAATIAQQAVFATAMNSFLAQ